MPDTTFKPVNETELVAFVAECFGERRTLRVQGGGSRNGVGGTGLEGQILDLSMLAGVVDYDPGELVITARAGTPLHEIKVLLAEHDQALAFEPPECGALCGNFGAAGTIGGAIAANAAGPRRVASGAARDHLLGFCAVSGKGEAFQSGGRVVKNVTGFDLSKLMAGSWGCIGVLSEVSVRVVPKAKVSSTLIIATESTELGVVMMTHALASPCSVSGAAYLPASAAYLAVGSSRPIVALRLEGFAAAVVARIERLRGLFSDFKADLLEGDDSQGLWEAIGAVDDLLPKSSPVYRISCPPSQTVERVTSLGGGWFVDWGGGLVWAAADRRPDGGTDGHAQCWRSLDGAAGGRPKIDPGVAMLMRRLKNVFDPADILNRGRLLPPVGEV